VLWQSIMSEGQPVATTAPRWTIRILTPVLPLEVDEASPDGATAAAKPALLPTPGPESRTPYGWLTQFNSAAKTRRNSEDSASAPLGWLSPLQLRDERERAEHAAYEATVKACVFPAVAPRHIQVTTTSTAGASSAESLEAVYMNWLQRCGLSPWICAHEHTCGHAYHVPVCSEKEQALLQRHLSRPDPRQAAAAALVSVAALSSEHQQQQPTLKRLRSEGSAPTPRPLLGGCTVCWKLRCLSDQLRRAVDADWRFLQSKASVQRLPAPLRMYRLQRLYAWLYREPHWNVWKSTGSGSES
jgi:hypothetical protein